MKFLILILLPLTLLSGCKYAMSPWETDVDCPGMWVPDNIARIQQLEAQQGVKDSFKVAVMGDPQMRPEDVQDAIEVINKRDDIDFIFLIGDLVEIGIKQEYEWTCKALSHSNKPIISVIGNHDSLSYGKEIWLKTFGPFDFSFTYQNTKFIAYNDNKYEFENVPDPLWLKQEADLEEGEIRNHTIGVSHIAPWDEQLELSLYLKFLNFDHMLHAHNHRFDFWQLQNVMLPHYVVSDVRDTQFGIMTVFPTSITMENCDPACVPATVRIRIPN